MKQAEEALQNGDYPRHVKLLGELVGQGDTNAMVDLGNLYKVGRIVERDPKKAHQLFERASTSGSLLGLCYVGECYETGLEVKKDVAKALALWRLADSKRFDRAPLFIGEYYMDQKDYTKAIPFVKKSIARGCAKGSYQLSSIYEKGNGVPKNTSISRKLLQEAAEGGSEAAIYELAFNYRFGTSGFSKDLKLGKKWAEKGAAKGDCDCMWLLGEIYMDVEKNSEKGLEFYKKCVEQRCPNACFELGRRYETGDQVPKNISKARELYEVAVTRDDGQAQNNLGNILAHGSDGRKPDPKAAFALYLKAAEQGIEQAQYNVGKALQEGVGVPRNSLAARKWLEAAMEQGNPHACNQLSVMYGKGTTDGIAKNVKEGVRLQLKAAEMGCPFAQLNLARSYEFGKHYPKDIKKAVYWYKKAAAQNVNDWVPYHLSEIYKAGAKGVPKDTKQAEKYYKQAETLGIGKKPQRLTN